MRSPKSGLKLGRDFSPEYQAFVASCPRQSIYKRPEDGIVLVDEERCRVKICRTPSTSAE